MVQHMVEMLNSNRHTCLLDTPSHMQFIWISQSSWQARRIFWSDVRHGGTASGRIGFQTGVARLARLFASPSRNNVRGGNIWMLSPGALGLPRLPLLHGDRGCTNQIRHRGALPYTQSGLQCLSFQDVLLHFVVSSYGLNVIVSRSFINGCTKGQKWHLSFRVIPCISKLCNEWYDRNSWFWVSPEYRFAFPLCWTKLLKCRGFAINYYLKEAEVLGLFSEFYNFKCRVTLDS